MPIVGGMWGYANERNRDQANTLFDLITNKEIAINYNKYGNSSKGLDQEFLSTHVWPHVPNNSIIHDSYFCKTLRGTPFPTQRSKIFCFASCSFCCDEKIFNVTWKDICPEDCRPKTHKDWIYC